MKLQFDTKFLKCFVSQRINELFFNVVQYLIASKLKYPGPLFSLHEAGEIAFESAEVYP